MHRPLLEREHELAELAAAAREAKGGDGSIVLVTGEAGIGKSSIVDAIRSVLPAEGRLLVGYCDDLATPRVLGPLRDLIGSVGTALTRALEGGDRSQVIDALRVEVDWPDHPTVLVVEDVHWADEATLDVLRFVARRIAALPAVLVLTYRDDNLTRDHPLQQLIGLAASTPRLRRLRPARLSAEAVRQMGVAAGISADQVFAVTSGNPFFVAEVLASGDTTGVPPTVAEAVRARLSDLDTPTRDALEQLAVVPAAAERWLVEAIVPGGIAALAAAEQRGVLTVSPSRVAFRHELARRAIVDSMPTARRVACNEAVLAALLERGDDVDLSRILHHAAEVGDADTIVRYGPAAAAEAVAAGSHREAVAHYRLVLAHGAAFADTVRAELLEGYAIECYTVGMADLAVRTQEEAVRLRRALGDAAALGSALRWLSRIYWWSGARPQAETSGAEAVDVLDTAGDPLALALALSNQSQLYGLAGRRSECIAVGERAVAMARDIGDAGVLSHALNNVGLGYSLDGDPRGQTNLEQSLAVALDAGEFEHACRAYVNIAWNLLGEVELDRAARVIEDAIAMAEEAEFFGFLRYMHVERAMLNLARGGWDQALRDAEWAVDAQLNMRCPALIVIGLVRIRRGDEGGDAVLAQAWEIATRLGEAQRIGPAASALAEAAWLRGDRAAMLSVLSPAAEEVRQFGDRADAAEMAHWMRLAGRPVAVDHTEHPFALLASGRWQEAAVRWQQAGCPYAYASALAESADPDDLLRALATLQTLGAEPLARRVRLRLRALGVTHVPRGPVPSTRVNPAGLTGRQVEVVQLLASGLTNAEIATQLVLSIRTVDSHVAAVMDKLGARTRREAAKTARTMGLIND